MKKIEYIKLQLYIIFIHGSYWMMVNYLNISTLMTTAALIPFPVFNLHLEWCNSHLASITTAT